VIRHGDDEVSPDVFEAHDLDIVLPATPENELAIMLFLAGWLTDEDECGCWCDGAV